MMYPKYLCHLGCLSAFLLPILYALPSVPLNYSIMKAEIGNHTLSAWPPHTGWKMHVDDLTIVFIGYGRFADDAQRSEITKALNDFRRRFLYDYEIQSPWPGLHYFYTSGDVQLEVRGTRMTLSGYSHISGKEFARVLYTINGLFFDPGGKPREITVEIKKSHVHPTYMKILWQESYNLWPQQLPFSIQMAHNLVMDVYIYARDFPNPNESFMDRVFHEWHALYREIFKENDGSRKPISKPAYISGILKLTIDPPSQAGQVLITAPETSHVLNKMEDMIFSRRYGFREFGTYIRNQRGQVLAKVSLLIDPEGFDDQPVLTLPSPNW